MTEASCCPGCVLCRCGKAEHDARVTKDLRERLYAADRKEERMRDELECALDRIEWAVLEARRELSAIKETA